MELFLHGLGNLLQERTSTVLFAMLLSVVFFMPLGWAEKLRLTAPASLFPALILWLENKLNRSKRSPVERRIRGFVVLSAVLLVAYMLGHTLDHMDTHGLETVVAHIIVLALFIPLRPLFDRTLYLARTLAAGNNELNRAVIGTAARRQVKTLDNHALCRATLENMAENFADYVISPLLWYILLGFPGVIMARAVNSMDRVIGLPSERLRDFGWAAARLDDFMQYIPARIAAWLFVMAALFVPSAYPVSALAAIRADANKTTSPNAGWPIAALAGALRLTLGGARAKEGCVIEDGWMGSGTAKATVRDIKRGLFLYAMASVLLMFFLTLLRLF